MTVRGREIPKNRIICLAVVDFMTCCPCFPQRRGEKPPAGKRSLFGAGAFISCELRPVGGDGDFCYVFACAFGAPLCACVAHCGSVEWKARADGGWRRRGRPTLRACVRLGAWRGKARAVATNAGGRARTTRRVLPGRGCTRGLPPACVRPAASSVEWTVGDAAFVGLGSAQFYPGPYLSNCFAGLWRCLRPGSKI